MPLSISKFSRDQIKTLFDSVVKKATSTGLVFLASPKSLEQARILIITSRKCGSAAKRNRIRRRLKSIFFENKLFLRQFDIAVIVKKEGIDSSFKDLEKALVKFANVASK